MGYFDNVLVKEGSRREVAAHGNFRDARLLLHSDLGNTPERLKSVSLYAIDVTG